MAEDTGEDQSESMPAPELYVFDVAHVADATALFDAAFVRLDDSYSRVKRVIELAQQLGLSDTPLMWEVVHASSHDLQREVGGRPGCSLGLVTKGDLFGWPRSVSAAPVEALKLWEAAAGSVSAPAANARLEDLLFERKVGKRRDHAQRAALSYVAAFGAAGEIGMEELDALLRAWTLAQSVKDPVIDAEVRTRMATVAASTMLNTLGAIPGAVLPLLSALASGPLTLPDPYDVDGLLARAAALFRKGYLAERIASDRRRRAGGDLVLLEQIARDEVASVGGLI